jgi:hypothetical protein
MEARQVGVSFSGGALAALGYTLLMTVLSLFVIPTAWGAAALMAWWTRSLVFPDGARAEFVGRAGRVWGLFAALVFVAFLPTVVTAGMPDGNRASLVSVVLTLALVPFEAALKLPLWRWSIESIRLEPGGSPRFEGRYGPYLAWSLLLLASFFTIIGWAWTAVAMARWFCRNIRAEAYSVSFVGTGGGLLWRGFVWVLGTACVIPLPWVLRSMYAWGAGNLVLLRHDAAGQPEYPAEHGLLAEASEGA